MDPEDYIREEQEKTKRAYMISIQEAREYLTYAETWAYHGDFYQMEAQLETVEDLIQGILLDLNPHRNRDE